MLITAWANIVASADADAGQTALVERNFPASNSKELAHVHVRKLQVPAKISEPTLVQKATSVDAAVTCTDVVADAIFNKNLYQHKLRSS
ncbi:hypothetical protein MTO96_030353 [Rhipicephalus appendiculatus]